MILIIVSWVLPESTSVCSFERSDVPWDADMDFICYILYWALGRGFCDVNRIEFWNIFAVFKGVGHFGVAVVFRSCCSAIGQVSKD